jgi:hypothetical protein
MLGRFGQNDLGYEAGKCGDFCGLFAELMG